MTLKPRPPAPLGALTWPPAKPASQRVHSGHQLPGCSVAPASQASADTAGLSFVQWLRLPALGGLITPAMWPDAPSTNLFLPPRILVDSQAPFHGTMWSSREP